MKIIDKPFAVVYWRDAHTVGGTTELAEHEIAHAPAHYTRYGFVLRQDQAGVTLASEHSNEHTYRGIDFIPAEMIVEIALVKLTPVRAKKTATVITLVNPEDLP